MTCQTILFWISFTPGLAAAQIELMSLLNEDIMMFKFSVLVQAEIFSFPKSSDVRLMTSSITSSNFNCRIEYLTAL